MDQQATVPHDLNPLNLIRFREASVGSDGLSGWEIGREAGAND